MKKIVTLLVLLACGVFWSCSVDDISGPDILEEEKLPFEITVKEAENELVGFIDQLQEEATRAGESMKRPSIGERISVGRPVGTRSADDGPAEPYIHIFNFENDEGFAIMSGDERVPSVLAYTFAGNYNPAVENDNPGFQIVLDNMGAMWNSELDRFEELVGKTDVEIKSRGIIDDYVDFGPWVYWQTVMYGTGSKVKWGQGDPYNRSLGFVTGSTINRYQTGCTITATAQLMSHYMSNGIYNGYVYQWDIMRKHISYKNPYPQAYTYISRLMQQLGLPSNLNATYNPESTPASQYNVPRTLRNFGFSNGGSVKTFNADQLVEEMKYGWHTLIVGYAFKNGNTVSGGHTWLANGLMRGEQNWYIKGTNIVYVTMTSRYVLCNWGWDDSQRDGWYLVGYFNSNTGPAMRSDPEEGQSRNYQYNMTMVTGIRP